MANSNDSKKNLDQGDDDLRKKYEVLLRRNDELKQKNRQLSERLSNSEEILRILNNQSLINITILQDGVFKWVNDLLCETTGYSKQEIMSWKTDEWQKIIHPSDVKFTIEQAQKKQSGEIEGVVTNYEFQLVTKTGEVKWMDLWSKTTEYENRSADLILAIEISDKKRALENLMESEREFRRLFLNSSDLILHIDFAGNILMANPSAEDILSHGSKKLVGMNLETLAKKGSWDSILEVFYDQIKFPGEREHYIIEFSRPSEKIVILDISTHLSYVNGEITGVQMFCRDITERKLLEDERIRAEQIESISLLAGGIAHDFNNILVGILGNINLLQYLGDLNEDQQLILDDMEKATHRAADLTNQLLTFSKGGTPVKACCNIHDIIEESVSFVMSGSKSSVRLSFADNIPMIDLDKGQINQVMNNLLINALQAMPNGGQITVETELTMGKEVEILPLDDEPYIKITVSDTGIGIPDDEKSKIFDPYYSTKEDGTGLGLATCFSIISRHDGFITFESEDGQGTSFFVYLPVIQKICKLQLKNPTIDGAIEEQDQSLNILIMDDDEMVLRTMRKILKKLGHNVYTTKSGRKAREVYENLLTKDVKIDLIIIDLTIPGGMGGVETVKAIRQLDSNVYAVVSSGYSNNPVLAGHKDFGFDDLLPKPFKLEDMRQVIKRYRMSLNN